MMLLSKGAEAELYLVGNRVVKVRVSKKYRVPELDIYIRKTRTRREAKLLTKARDAGIVAPRVFDVREGEFIIEMEYVSGILLRDHLIDTFDWDVLYDVGRNVAALHDAGIVHGDITTSNIILRGNSLVFIDFGLGEVTDSVEAKAVDLVCFKKSFFATHASISREGWGRFLEGYDLSEDSGRVLERMVVVEKRARYL